MKGVEDDAIRSLVVKEIGPEEVLGLGEGGQGFRSEWKALRLSKQD